VSLAITGHVSAAEMRSADTHASIETRPFVRACSAAETCRTGIEIRTIAGAHAGATRIRRAATAGSAATSATAGFGRRIRGT
jgi:hypothetical protein